MTRTTTVRKHPRRTKTGVTNVRQHDRRLALKKRALGYRYSKTFIDENTNEIMESWEPGQDVKEGVDDVRDLYYDVKMDAEEPEEIGIEQAIKTAYGSIREGTLYGWFRTQDKQFKPKLLEEILAEKGTLNAGWNIMYYHYQFHGGGNVSFDEFMDTEITLYRGGGFRDEPFTSFSFDREIAEKFTNPSKSGFKKPRTVMAIKIRPRDTLGSYREASESEVLIPRHRYDRATIVEVDG